MSTVSCCGDDGASIKSTHHRPNHCRRELWKLRETMATQHTRPPVHNMNKWVVVSQQLCSKVWHAGISKPRELLSMFAILSRAQ